MAAVHAFPYAMRSVSSLCCRSVGVHSKSRPTHFSIIESQYVSACDERVSPTCGLDWFGALWSAILRPATENHKIICVLHHVLYHIWDDALIVRHSSSLWADGQVQISEDSIPTRWSAPYEIMWRLFRLHIGSSSPSTCPF